MGRDPRLITKGVIVIPLRTSIHLSLFPGYTHNRTSCLCFYMMEQFLLQDIFSQDRLCLQTEPNKCFLLKILSPGNEKTNPCLYSLSKLHIEVHTHTTKHTYLEAYAHMACGYLVTSLHISTYAHIDFWVQNHESHKNILFLTPTVHTQF